MPPVTWQSHQFLATRNCRFREFGGHISSVRNFIKVLYINIFFRGNPLINRFVREITYSPPSLLELAGRSVIHHQLDFSKLPAVLKQRLSHAKCCPNPNCDGVYFDDLYRQVHFFSRNQRSSNFLFRLNLPISVVDIGCPCFNFYARPSAWHQKLTTQGKNDRNTPIYEILLRQWSIND